MSFFTSYRLKSVVIGFTFQRKMLKLCYFWSRIIRKVCLRFCSCSNLNVFVWTHVSGGSNIKVVLSDSLQNCVNTSFLRKEKIKHYSLMILRSVCQLTLSSISESIKNQARIPLIEWVCFQNNMLLFLTMFLLHAANLNAQGNYFVSMIPFKR